MREMNTKQVMVTLVNGTVIRGKTNIANARRLSDFFNKSENFFVVLFDTDMKGQEGGVIFINREHILFVQPDEDNSHGDPRGAVPRTETETT